MNRRLITAAVWIGLIVIVLVAVANRSGNRGHSAVPISHERAIEMIDDGQIVSQSFRDGQLMLNSADDLQYVVRPLQPALIHHLNTSRVPYAKGSAESSSYSGVWTLALALLAIVALILLLRQLRGGQVNKFMELRKSKARPISPSDRAMFADIGGNREAVETLADVVDFLKSPRHWKAANARLPRGVMMVGPPGTGKTLMARAVAGETNAAFFYTSATEFVEMFVGVGPARVRDTFEKAAAKQPAVVFIDEIDAVGRRRGSGVGAMHEEREQTLNQLLVLLDGLERHDRLVVMAATNRLDVLDPALLRSGRFDRILKLGPPTVQERMEILKIHTRNKPLDAGVSLQQIASQTDGFTGADLESLTNDAVLIAIRRWRQQSTANADSAVIVTLEDFQTALKKMVQSNRQFDRLDAVLVESVSQFAEPTGRAAARIQLTTGTTVDGDVVWMNATHIKLKKSDGSEVTVAKNLVETIVRREGTELIGTEDFSPDRWAGKTPGAG